jgi:uncharacterized protein YgbK (DUF1537 family)
MSIALGVVADDYTGASDLANALTRNGLTTVQTIGVPVDGLTLPDVDAVVVALKSRSIPAAEAVERSLAADRWLRAQGADHVLFKICSTFDSTDAGNIGPVTDALAAACGERAVLVNPSFPETRRTVYQGHLFVAEVEALAEHRDALAAAGVGSVIVDAVFERDLEVIGAVAASRKLSVGASGIGIGLARALTVSGRASGRTDAAAGAPVGGPAVCLAGSCSRATLAQIERAEASMPVLHLDVEDVLALGGAVERAIAWAGERIAAGPLLVASSADASAVGRLQERHGREHTGNAIEAAMATLAEAMVARGVRRLVVAGGETSGAVVDRLGLAAFLIGREIAAGVPVLHTVGRADRMSLALKSGNFGGPDFFADALAAMP